MLSRKRRASSISSRQDEDPLLLDDSTPEQSPVQQTQTARKKRRLDPTELCQQLYDSIRNIKKEDGSMLCDTFIRAPKRRQEPSYYDVVVNPIDLLKVQQKLKTDSYDDLYDMMNDLELLINNAKAFYKPDSSEHQDALALWQHIQTQRQRILDANGFTEEEPRAKRAPRNNTRRLTGSAEPGGGDLDDDCNQYEELFASVMTATDPVGDRAMHPIFQLLPSKKAYPDYYDVIEHPIDLRLIATKIQMNAYSSLVEMERDLLQMTKNACLFNEPGSQIYKDAKALKRIFTQRRIELETGKGKPVRRLKSLSSAVIAALKEEVDSSDDEETSKKGEGPMWALFDHLYNSPGTSEHPGVTGPPLGNSLWKLPVRRFHPEYFELIKRPISMGQIHTKLKKGDYANISDLTGDLYLMLDNAKKAFPATHRTHKDALKMLKLMNAKLVEETLEETSDMDEEEADEVFTTSVQPEKRKPGRPRVNSNSNPSTSHASTNSNSPKSNRIPINATIKKKILSIQKYLVDYTVEYRRLIEMFMEKPSRRAYPDYYEIIQNPIDMNTIEHNIRSDRYATVEDVVADYRLMFSNCRQYNEDCSTIYEDANTLERALNEKLKEFPGLTEVKRPVQKYKMGRKPKASLLADRDRMWQFYESLRDYQEPKGKRQLSLIFTKLPSKSDYPEYYDIIKDPMDMERIAQKLKQGAYDSVDELAADFLLMLENACKYNEPDSQIYKDALVLQQLTLQLKQQLRTEPDVPLAVQELFLTLFTSVYNHQDEEGRCYSDSLAELAEYDELGEGAKVRGISLDLVKRRLDKGAYKRLDVYQEDIFACLERARKLSRTDSDIFQDSIELQTYFIRKRDELCKDTLSSPALSFTLDKLLADVEVTRQQKAAQEEDQEQDKEKDEFGASAKGESMTINQQVYSPGDYVYIQMPENKIPTIVCIERLWTTPTNEKLMQASIFLRPHETYHVTTRKFLEKEVFKSSLSQTISMDKVLGMCYVMPIRDYIKMRPDGLPEKDVFVCESRYNVQGRCFKKLKNWSTSRESNSSVRFVPRETPLELKRVMSVFKERIEKHKGELEELKLQEVLIEKEKPNVICDAPPNAEDNSVYYQQYNTICSGVIKTGDFVYVATQTGKQSVAQVQQIWEINGKSYFKGPWLLPPSETTPAVGKQFYRQELLLSTVEDISPVIGIVGRCAVLEYAEFINSRPTEISESDVYICESVYDELKKALRNLVVGNLRKFQHSAEVTEDEIFYFKSPIKPAKDTKGEISELAMLEDSMDGDTPSLSSDIVAISSPAPSINSTPLTSKAKTKTAKKSLTGYILYSSDVRKSRSQSNPDASFGDISRLVGNEWKSLPSSVKQSWEDRANKLNEEAAALRREMDDGQNCASPLPANATTNQETGPTLTFECLWDKCDYQFEELSDCTEHCLSDATGHINRHPQAGVEMEYVCLWRNCPRIRKSIQAFPNVLRLIKHVREVHLSKCGKPLPLTERNKNFMPRKQKSMGPQQSVSVANTSSNAISPRAPINIETAQQHQQQLQLQQQQQQLQQQQQQQHQQQHLQQTILTGPPPEPMFVTVPPRANRVIHSEAYIKYIESLQTGSHLVVSHCNNNWRRALTHITPQQVPKAQLPEHWLGPNLRDQGNVVQALCHLRNFMLDDVLQIQHSCT